MDCDRCGKRFKSNHIVNVQRHYESDSCKRKTAEMNLQKMQQSQPPAEKRQRLLCTSAANAEEPVACNEPVAVACEESAHSVVEQNQRLPKPFCRGYLPDVPSPFVQNWAFAAHRLQQQQQQQLPFTVGVQLKVPANRIATFATHTSVRSCSIVATCKKSTLEAIFGSMLQHEGSAGQMSTLVWRWQSYFPLFWHVVKRHYIFITTWFL